ncbi:MAG: transporter [Aeromicrobium sp.]|jgi:MFS family permease|uniref:MFS transporter n=1 Tax=Aeromicrobium sp. TaxID=1871063 RepID=UPI002607FFBD|nr:MFS transporter [Aeromicrobium sp.]MCW2788136.1 transporter [Aeromicrobium sp.]MCW2823868.1 transporter [Aeromicrobium sp.]
MEEHEGPYDYAKDQPPSSPTPPSRLARSGRAARRISSGTARVVAKGGTSAFSGARRFTHSGGAGESGFARLLELHAFNTAGDAAVAISLAGTLFFTVPTGEATGQVALFLVLTMLPFAIVAPLIGPFLDRFRRGRRWAIGATLAIRAFCCWVLAGAVVDESPAFYFAALGCLVASKAYGVTRASAVPRLLPAAFTLVKANSRISLTGTAAAAISAPLAVGAATVGAEWALRYGAVLFAIGTVLAILLPAKVDSSEGEDPVDLTPRVGAVRKGLSITRPVVNALRSNSGLRLLSGFLTIFMAFTLREPPASMGWDGNPTILLGLVVGGAGVGNTIGTLIGSAASSRRPEKVVIGVLVLDVAVLATVGVFFTWWTAVILGLTVGICQSLGKLSLDALIQRDVPERVRTSMFARSETLLQLGWVLGGLLGIGLFSLDATPRIGLLVIGAILIGWLALVLTRAMRPDPAAPSTSAPQGDEPTRRFSS